MDGPKGASTIDLNLSTGVAVVTTDRAATMLMIQDLCRGKNVGAAWRWVIDLSAYLILALSIIGYVLFFSLTAGSLVVLVGIVVLFIP